MPFIAGVKHILATEGPRGLYQGVGATILKQGSNQGLRFMWFNEYKKVSVACSTRTSTSYQAVLSMTLNAWHIMRH